MSTFFRRFVNFRRLGKVHPSPVAAYSSWPHHTTTTNRLSALFAAAVAGSTFYYYLKKDYRNKPSIVNCVTDKDCNPNVNKEKECIGIKCENSACLLKMDKEEELIAKANSELETALKDVKAKVIENTEAALKVFCEASGLTREFMDKVYCAANEDGLESPRFEEIWCGVSELSEKRSEKVKGALIKGPCAWEVLHSLREIIESGKSCEYTRCNPLLATTEEILNCAEKELLDAKVKMDCLMTESRLIEQYGRLVETFRRALKVEIYSLMPGEDCKYTLTDNECVMVITHAYKKVLRAQNELAQVNDCIELAPPKLG